jgi:hypothetical protein
VEEVGAIWHIGGSGGVQGDRMHRKAGSVGQRPGYPRSLDNSIAKTYPT